MFESFFSPAFVVGDLSERDVGARGFLLIELERSFEMFARGLFVAFENGPTEV